MNNFVKFKNFPCKKHSLNITEMYIYIKKQFSIEYRTFLTFGKLISNSLYLGLLKYKIARNNFFV